MATRSGWKSWIPAWTSARGSSEKQRSQSTFSWRSGRAAMTERTPNGITGSGITSRLAETNPTRIGTFYYSKGFQTGSRHERRGQCNKDKSGVKGRTDDSLLKGHCRQNDFHGSAGVHGTACRPGVLPMQTRDSRSEGAADYFSNTGDEKERGGQS